MSSIMSSGFVNGARSPLLALGLGFLLFHLTSCAWMALPDVRTQPQPGIDRFVWVPSAEQRPGRLYAVITANPCWMFDDSMPDLPYLYRSELILRHARGALEEAERHGTEEVRIVFFVRYQPQWTVGETAEFTVCQLRHIATDPLPDAKRLVFEQTRYWPHRMLPPD